MGELELAYETFGDAADPAVLMIMGLGAPMIFWPEELCEMLADRGHFVIRFDNRDIGRSTILDEPPPRLDQMLSGELDDVPYRLEDMAADAVGVLDHLGVERAHIVGASLGGMIAQRLAIDRPERVLSLASIMSTTGDRSVGHPTPAALAVLMAPPPTGRDGYVRSYPRRPRRDRLEAARHRGGPASSPGAASTAASTRRAPRASWRRSWPRRTEPRRSARSGRRPWSSTVPTTR